MPKCPTCTKEVYFGRFGFQKKECQYLSAESEKVTSLGKDWHRGCLRCEKCKKTLAAGSHAEHDNKPYCNKPCYSALFGPKGFGHGGSESHKY